MLVAPDEVEDTYVLIDGNHRVTALEELKIDKVEALLDETLVTEALQLRRARLANEVAETVVLTTFVDDAELIWRLTEQKMTQTETGGVLGWSRDKVAKYIALQDISKGAWDVIVTNVFEHGTIADNESVTSNVTNVTLSEGLLRHILPLTSSQQYDLITGLIDETINKNKFKSQSEVYKSRNEMRDYALIQLQGLSEEYTNQATQAIYSGAYDKDWKTDNRPKLSKLIASILEEWEEKSGIQLIHGDFNEEVKLLEDNSIDLILTDPPYNISQSGKVTKQGSKIVNADFGGADQWDNKNISDFINELNNWVKEWERVLRQGGAVISFCDKALVSQLWDMFITNGLAPKNVIVWEKDNPSPAGKARRNLISATEFIVWGVKPGNEYTFNDSDLWKMTNVINSPICGGNERIKDFNENTLHPTQKPEKLLAPLVEVFSNRGDVILDGFAGTGSTGAVAKSGKRKFIGIEKNSIFYNSMKERLA